MELAIDAVGAQSSVAVSDEGVLVAEITWPTGRRHTPTLVPMIDQVCRLAGVARADLRAVFVDVGPGAYGGIRAGMAAATGVALALDLPLIGVDRLQIDAYAHAAARGPIVALHDASRGQLAVGVYHGPAAHWREELAPALLTPAALADRLRGLGEVGVLCGEVAALGDAAVSHLSQQGWTVAGPAASIRRAGVLAELGWRELARLRAAGHERPSHPPEPLYLREPSIGPPPPPLDEPFPLDPPPAGALTSQEADA